jgi:hypothetical protein
VTVGDDALRLDGREEGRQRGAIDQGHTDEDEVR